MSLLAQTVSHQLTRRQHSAAAAKTNTKAVDVDGGLLSEAVSLPDDEFAERARRWLSDPQAASDTLGTEEEPLASENPSPEGRT